LQALRIARLMENEGISARIKELKTAAISEGVVSAEIPRRSPACW
jgi:hypothetical protein